MTLLYNKIQRGVPGKPEEPKKWYISVKTLGQVGEKDVARQIADETTLNPQGTQDGHLRRLVPLRRGYGTATCCVFVCNTLHFLSQHIAFIYPAYDAREQGI